MRLPFILVLVWLLSSCSPPDFYQIVSEKMAFMTELRTKEGKQTHTGKVDTTLLCNGIFFRTFQEPITGVADPVTAKINFLSSRLFYRFEKPNHMGLGRVWISNRFTDADFQQYYEKGRGLDFEKMGKDQGNTYLKIYEIDENDGQVTIYTDDLTGKFYKYKGQCINREKQSNNDKATKNYWLSEAMNYRMERVTKGGDGQGLAREYVVLNKVSGKYPNSTDIFTDKPMTLVRMEKGDAGNVVVKELVEYERDQSFKTAENICPFRWEAIQGLMVDSLISRKVIPGSDSVQFNKELVTKTRRDTGWIFAGSASKDHKKWINQRIPETVEGLEKLKSNSRMQTQSRSPFSDSLVVDFPTFLRAKPPIYAGDVKQPKGTIVNILLPGDTYGILDLHWAPSLNQEREVLWLQVKKLKPKK